MTDQPPTDPGVPARLHELARLLRQADHLDPEKQQELADLVDELGQSVHPEALTPGEAAHLTDSVAHLVRALHERHDPGLLEAARERLRRAAARAEAQAPVATGIVRRLIDTLANLGI